MAGLLDIGKLRKTLIIRGVEVPIEGLTARGLFELLDKFPELRKLMSDAGVAVNPTQFMTQVPGAVSTIIVYVCGHRRASLVDFNNTEKFATINKAYDDAIEAADNLTLGEQTEIVKAAWDLTFPKGIQSFIEALEGVGAIGSGWAQASASPGQSSSVSPPATPPT